MDRLEARIGPWVLRWRWWIIVVTLVLVGIAAGGLRHLSFTTNYRIFFSADNPQLLAFEALENTYNKNDNVLFVLAPKHGKVFDRRVLAAVEALTERCWQIPYSNRVNSLSNFQHTEAQGDDLVVRDLIDGALAMSDEQIEAARVIALSEPQLLGLTIPARSHVTGVSVTVQLPGKDLTREVPGVVEVVRTLADEFRADYPDIDLYLTGMVMMNNAFSEHSLMDMQTLVPLSFGVMVLAMLLLLRSLTATCVALCVICMSIVSAMGIGGYFGVPISPPSASAPTIMLTMAIANCVHVLVTLLHGLGEGQEKAKALRESLRVNLQPVFLASLTTCLGFLSMNFSDAPPFRHLGNLVAMGVAVSFVLAITFLPALISLLPLRARRIVSDEQTLMTRFGVFVVRYQRPLLWGMTALVLVLVSSVPRNELNDVFVNYFDETVQFRSDSDFTTKNLTGIYVIEYSLESGEAGGINEPEFLHDLAAFSEWYSRQPEVMHVNTLSDIMKRLNKNMHGDVADWYRLPDSRELAAQYLLLYEMSLPYGLDLNNQINIDKSSVRLVITLKTLSSNALLALEQRAQQWLAENGSRLRAAEGTGPSMMFAHIGKRNIISMLVGTTVALVFISLILMVALRSVKIGLISLLPNLVPGAMAFGLWGLLVGEVGLALSVVTGMTLGIVVDDTVHFLSKYLRARRERGFSASEAVVYAFRTVGRALVVTSVILVAGFLVLSQSSFELNAGMGLLTAIVITLALMADFLLLPPLLIKLEGGKDEKVVFDDSTSGPTVN